MVVFWRNPSDSKIQEANKSIEINASKRVLVYIDIYSLYDENGKLPSSITRDGLQLYPQNHDRWAKNIESYEME